jgi:hypothetical protein
MPNAIAIPPLRFRANLPSGAPMNLNELNGLCKPRGLRGGFFRLDSEAIRSEIIGGREFCLVGGRVMSGQAVRVSTSYTCAYCSEPLSFTSHGINAWRVGDRFVCNEFCADGIYADNEIPASAFRQPQTGHSIDR